MPERLDEAGLSTENAETLSRMIRAIDLAEGFALFFARCNASALRSQLMLIASQELAALGVEMVGVAFAEDAVDVRQRLRSALQSVGDEAAAPILIELPHAALAVAEPAPTYETTAKRAVFVTGLEIGIPYGQPNTRTLAELNLGRDQFPHDVPHPLVLWLPDYALTAVARFAPDFWAWRSGVFEFETGESERSAAFQTSVEQGPGWRALANLGTEARLLRQRQLESLLDDYRDLPDDPRTRKERAQILADLGHVCSASQAYDEAIRYYQQALELQRQVGDRGGEAATLNNIGLVYSALGDKGKALDYYEQALPLSRQVGDRGGEATILNNIGRVYADLGDKGKALAYYEQALPLFGQVGDRRGEATTLNNIGAVYDALGDKGKALAYYDQVLPMHRQLGNRAVEATTLNNIGRVYADLGDKGKALAYYEQALPLRRQVGDRGGEATTLNNIGRVYDDLGDKGKALDYYEQALPLRRQVGDRGGEATTLNNIGGVYDDLGDKGKALAYFEQALPLRRQVGDRWGEIVTRYNIARVYEELGDIDRAVAGMETAVALAEATGHPNAARYRAELEMLRVRR